MFRIFTFGRSRSPAKKGTPHGSPRELVSLIWTGNHTNRASYLVSGLKLQKQQARSAGHLDTKL